MLSLKSVALWASALIAAFLSLDAATAQSSSDFASLGLLEQRDFKEMARRLYVIGDPRSPSGLFLSQQMKLEDLEAAALTSIKSDSPYVQKLAESLFNLEDQKWDWILEFDRYVRENPERLASLYSNAIKKIVEPQNQNFENLLRLLSLEYDQKLYLLQHPLTGSAEVFPGLRGHRLSSFLELTGTKLSEEDQRKIESGETLSFEDYSRLHSKNQDLYLIYHLSHLANIPSFEELQKQAPEAQESQLRTLWIVIQARNKSNLQLSWSRLESPEEKISAAHWVVENFQNVWPKFSDIQFSVETQDWSSFQNEVDDMLVSQMEGSEIYYFSRVREQIQDLDWSFEASKEKAYSHLSDKLRRLVAARSFPDLSLAEARGLLEGRIFELSEEERLHILQAAFPEPNEAARSLQKQMQIDLENSKEILLYHLDLLRAYKARKFEMPPPTEMILSDGKTKVPLLKPMRDEMKLLIKQNQEQINPGIYPRWLIEKLMTTFYSDNNHFENEALRFKEEWKRENLIRENLDRIQSLVKASKKAESDDERSKIQSELLSLQMNFNDELAKYPIDPDSEATILAAFSYGFIPTHWKDAGDVAKVAATGFVFMVVTRFVGVKAVSLFIMTDTGLRFLTANYFTEDGKPLDLSNGYSTPIGLWTAQGLNHSFDLLDRLLRESRPEDKLEAYRELGVFARDTLAFSAGARIASLTFDLTRLARIRRIRSAQIQLERMKAQLIANEEKMARLSSEISQVEKQMQMLEKAKLTATEAYQEATQKLWKAREEISVTQKDTVGIHQGKMRSLSIWIVHQVLSLCENLLPIPKSTAGAPNFIERFRRRLDVGLKQYESELVRLENSISELQAKEVMRQASKDFRSGYKEFEGSQEAQARSLGTSQDLLEMNKISEASSALDQALELSRVQIEALERLKAQAPASSSLSPQDRALFKGEKWISEKAKPSLTRQRVPQLADDFFSSDRMLDGLRLTIRDQLGVINELIQSIEAKIPQVPESARPGLIENLQQLKMKATSISGKLRPKI